mgnify:CR=1 FL=1
MEANPSLAMPWWAKRPTKDVITILLLLATGAAMGRLAPGCRSECSAPVTLGPGGAGTVVDVTPDGSRAAVARPDGQVTVYDLANRKAVRRLETKGGSPTAVAVAPDGRGVAVGFPGAPAVFYTEEEGTQARPLGPETAGARALAFSEDGGRLACYAEPDAMLTVWTVPDAERISSAGLSPYEVQTGCRLAFSDAGKAVVVIAFREHQVAWHEVIAVDTGERIRCLGGWETGDDRPAFHTASGRYTRYTFDLHSYEDEPDASFTGTVMAPWGGGRQGPHTNLFQLSIAVVLSGAVGTIAFDAEADRVVYASADGGVHLARRTAGRPWWRRPGPWVALGLVVLLAAWSAMAWIPQTRWVEADVAAVEQAALRLDPAERRMPLDLFILVYLLALAGLLGIAEMVAVLFFDAMRIDLVPFLNLFAAARLLQFRRGWRLFVLFELWLLFFGVGALAGQLVLPGHSPVGRAIWGGQVILPEAVAWAGVAALLAIATWAFRVLTRFRTRVLFFQPADTQGDNGAAAPEPSPQTDSNG